MTEHHDPDFLFECAIQVHQSRVCPCPPAFPAGYYWYGPKRKEPGRPPKWIDKLLSDPIPAEPDQPRKLITEKHSAEIPDAETPDSAEESPVQEEEPLDEQSVLSERVQNPSTEQIREKTVISASGRKCRLLIATCDELVGKFLTKRGGDVTEMHYDL